MITQQEGNNITNNNRELRTECNIAVGHDMTRGVAALIFRGTGAPHFGSPCWMPFIRAWFASSSRIW